MNIIRKFKRIRRIKNILKIIIVYRLKGYPYYIAKSWGRKVHRDLISDNGRTKKEKRWAHRRGFLSYSIKKYGLTEDNYKEFFSDFQYTLLAPINNAYKKWLSDRLTPCYILKGYEEYLPNLYCNIIRRNGGQIYIPLNKDRPLDGIDDLLNLVKEKGEVLLLPSENNYIKASYDIKYDDGKLKVNNEDIAEEQQKKLITGLRRYYVLSERVENCRDIKELFAGSEMEFVFILSNDESGKTRILCSYARSERPYSFGLDISARVKEQPMQVIIDKENGTFKYEKSEEQIEGQVPLWKEMCSLSEQIGNHISEIEYMSIVFKVSQEGLKIVGYHDMPTMPKGISPENELNLYLKKRAEDKAQRICFGGIKTKGKIKRRAIRFLKRHYFRKGFREYMLASWLNLVKDDFLNTKSTTLKEKLWAWKRGFTSYRIQQYSLTEKNCRQILSDYDYAWLNRINNGYQKWINDKTTMRYVLDEAKEYMAGYYFFISKKNGKLFIKKLQDCPEHIGRADSDGILQLLREKEKLVMKPNAGTHGDGFYKLEYTDEAFFVNEKESSADRIKELISSQKSSYVITEYIEMHRDLKKIYPGSVNTIRMMVINKTCFEPKIVQTYMRIGSSKTGVTDNIAYGGLAAYVDKDSGYYDRAALLSDHRYISMDHHPDTGTLLEGYLPNWETVKKGVYDISMMIPQLEYLGFDIAITEDGFKILEINIHQDIHKAHEFTEEINRFFSEKIQYKKELFNLTK